MLMNGKSCLIRLLHLITYTGKKFGTSVFSLRGFLKFLRSHNFTVSSPRKTEILVMAILKSVKELNCFNFKNTQQENLRLVF